jgi:zinc finger protein
MLSLNAFFRCSYAPLPDPLLSIQFFDRSPEEQAALGFLIDANTLEQKDGRASHEDKIMKERQTYTPAGTTKMPHGAVGAELAHRAIAQGSSADVAAALFKYSAPEEVCCLGTVFKRPSEFEII